MKLPHALHAVIFDMDGTLHDTEHVYDTAQRHAAVTLGHDVSDAFWHSMVGVPGRDCNVMMQEHLGPGFSLAAFNEIYVRQRDAMLGQAVALKPGVIELLNHLGERDIPVAVATSNTRDGAERHLGKSGLRQRFEVVVTVDDVARGKPHPDLFLLAAQRLGVAPANCLVIEDAFTGIRGAHAAGMMPVLVPDLLAATPEMAALCVGVLADLHEVRRRLPR